jgi:NAD(P)-dependent dehydrogenase (short-subunit alcohol dehydrogenase family)
VEALDRRIVARKADVRDYDGLVAAYQAGVAELGPVDIVLANAGICQLGSAEPDPAQSFRTVIDVNLVGVWNASPASRSRWMRDSLPADQWIPRWPGQGPARDPSK